MNKLSKEDLKKLLDYGLIAEAEQNHILSTYDHESIEAVEKKIVSVFEASIKAAEAEEGELEIEKKKLLAEDGKLNEEIFALRIKKSKAKAQKEIEKYRAEQELHDKKIAALALEYKRARRKLGELISQAGRQLKTDDLQKVREKLKSS